MKNIISITISLFLLLAAFGCAAEEPADRADAETADRWETKELRTQYEDIRLTRLVGGLEHPWSVDFLPDGRKLITERPGGLKLVENGNVTDVNGIPEATARGQGGMMEVSVHPNYEENGWIYLTYSKGNDEGQTAVALVRGQLEGNEFVNQEEIFIQNRYSQPGRHYGSKLAWDNNGYLYMSIGDRGNEPPRAQELSDHAGTLLRMYDDGSVPSDNPFIDDPDVADEIYSYGHRNIQGLVIDPETNEIWATEHGPRGGDELNYVEPGENYGWPRASMGRDYGDEHEFHAGTEARHIEGMIDPVYEFLPTLAPSGLALVTADNFPNWKGNLLAGGLVAERIRRLYIEVYDGAHTVIHDEELLLGEVGRIRDVREGPDGNIYVVTDENPGGLYVVEPLDD